MGGGSCGGTSVLSADAVGIWPVCALHPMMAMAMMDKDQTNKQWNRFMSKGYPTGQHALLNCEASFVTRQGANFKMADDVVTMSGWRPS
jgi:hypothetical protein